MRIACNKHLLPIYNIEHPGTDAGGLSLACMWLDLQTTIKVSKPEMH
jgi:hypothetical protein